MRYYSAFAGILTELLGLGLNSLVVTAGVGVLLLLLQQLLW
jgi:hypothetical protein